MLKIQHYSISKKLTWINMLVSGVALLLACAAFFAYDLYTFRVGIVRNLSTQAQIIGSNTVSALVFNDPHAAENTLSALKASPHILYAAIYTTDGQPFAGYWLDGNGKTLPLPALPAGQTQANWVSGGQISLVDSIIFQGKPTGFVYIQSDLRAVNDRLKSYAFITASVLMISLVVALLISRVSQRIISEPVVQLAQTVRVVSHEKNYSVRAATTGNHDEVSTLIEAFNEMLGQIQQRDGALQQAHDKLEQRVQERTTQLGAANKELELKNREVERATKLKSQFLASMSHELRTPLNAIIGFSDLLAEKTAGPLTDKQGRFVGHVRDGAHHLLQLINDILDLSKIEAGQLELRRENFQIAEALPEVLSTIRPLAMAKNINVEQKGTTGLSVYADRVRFKQILYNLLSNAVKFTPKGGQIEIDYHQVGNLASISVKDTGIGIRPEDQAAVSTAKSPLVSGVALKRDACKPLVLIVDDELSSRELLASYLSSEYRIAMAESGAEALEKVKQLRPDAVTLDVLMEKGDGLETLVALRNQAETATMPVIILSIVDKKNVGFALGATDYLIKPIRKPQLLDTMHKHVSPRADDDSVILLVDDDPKCLELLEDTLRSAGYETQSVQSGARALEVLSSKIVSAVLLDLLMPGMDGFQVIGHIRHQATLRELPIFVMTAKTLTEEDLAILRKETQACFQKGGSWQQQLIDEISRVIQGRRAKAAGQQL